MGTGASVFLLAVGAVLAFAVTDNVNGVDLTAVGYILMAAGVIGLIWSIWVVNARRDTTHRVIEDRLEDRHIHDDRL
jgi:hypothetical protein